MQTLETMEKALKENYLPAWQNQLSIEPSPLLAKIKKVPLKSNKIVATAPIGLAGGFGYGAEGQKTPVSGNQNFERFETTAKDMYVNMCISEKAVRLTGSAGSMVNALDAEVKGSYAAAKWNVGRSLYGNGKGILTTCSALTQAGNTISVDDVKNLIEGLIIDIYATDASLPQANGKARRIKSIDRVNKTITLVGEAATFSAGFITVQNSYNREITGLGAIFDDNIDVIYNLSKTENPFLKPDVYGIDDITESAISKALRTAKNIKNNEVDVILCGDDAFDKYVDYLRDTNHRVEDMTKELVGGFRAIKHVFGNREVEIINESFIPVNNMWGINTKTLELHESKWNFAKLQGGSIFNLMDGESAYRALLANYGDLICTNPGGCFRIEVA